ncbi:MAG: AAA family ATPase [Halobacterium sp.]
MILVVCGPPGSGKTTIATRLHRRLEDDGFDVRIVHTDDLATPVYDRLFERVAEAPGDDWILDGTFYEREFQARVRAFPDVRFVLVTADRDTCIRRNYERDGIPERAVKVLYDEFDWPDADFVVDTDVLRVETAVDLVYERASEWFAES